MGIPKSRRVVDASLPKRDLTFQDFIILAANKDHPDLLISKSLSHHGKLWENVLGDLRTEGAFMPNLRIYHNFLNALISASDSNTRLYDGRGKFIEDCEALRLYRNITQARDNRIPKSEFLDAYFRLTQEGKITVTYHKPRRGGGLELVTEPLEDCLMEDRTPGIDLNSWLSEANIQGLPSRRIAHGGLDYWHPRQDSIAWFKAGIDMTVLDCYGNPHFSDPTLGVRKVFIRRSN